MKSLHPASFLKCCIAFEAKQEAKSSRHCNGLGSIRNKSNKSY